MDETGVLIRHVFFKKRFQGMEIPEPVKWGFRTFGGIFLVPVLGEREALLFGFAHRCSYETRKLEFGEETFEPEQP